jgi:hypothetical protein
MKGDVFMRANTRHEGKMKDYRELHKTEGGSADRESL